MTKNERINKIVSAIKEVAKDLDITPDDVKKSDLLNSGKISDWDLKMVGGLTPLKKASFPVVNKDLKAIVETKDVNSYISKLEKQVGRSELTKDVILESLKNLILPVKVPKPKVLKKKSKMRRDVVVMVNDTHFGLNVDPKEVDGINEFNWDVASRRMAFLAQQVADYKIEKRHEVENLHIVLNGDLIAGAIHDLMSKTQDLLGIQQNGTMHILTYFIGYVSQFFKNTIVYCGHGNHDNQPHRREGGRVISHVGKDSLTTPIHYALSLAFRTTKNIQFKMMESLYLDLQLPAGRAIAVHGDILFSKQLGNPGSNLNIKSLSDAINRFNSGELQKGREKIKLILFGHTHVKVNFTTFDGTEVYNAPSLSGVDAYAYSLGINHNHVGQIIFESTEKYIFGDARLVDLSAAGTDKQLDTIIPKFKNSLKFE